MDKNKSSKISVAGYEDSSTLMGRAENLGVLCCRQSDLAHANNVMPKARQKGRSTAVDILIDEEFYDVVT